MLSFNFAGKDSYLDYGIIIKRPSLSSPKKRISYIEIPGRDSSLRYDEGTFEDITITVECTLIGDNLFEKIDQIKAWLFGAGESDLIFSFQNDKKYLAQVVNSVDFKQIINYISEFPIIFNCRPFKYAVLNDLVTITQSGTNLINPGTIYSLPKIYVYGSGDITIKVNGEELKINSFQNKIIIDSILYDCYDDDFNNLNSKVDGNFPILKVGSNIIEWTGNVSKVEILPNWRWL
ncbi:putative phage tail component, N-terminal domain-containing protein [Caloramator quimbayensis]|uniref:Putative phage tail component, N-terminal domain-containing protein n=1 Tax=Caloramator quimbayensis TaxID=1147123 RepID=A0A1T4YEU4_9CLOT|nr:distal tail protein Dit [Caloramator quimbayensis]SKA99755.1 putative phage tail component, N-terminal domain-containing protein [Caloramator quimbayensis]